MTPQLLVSVRSADEAALAVLGGAALIDIKEPRRGSLGRASDATLRAVLHQVAGRRPVSAALGELAEDSPLPGRWEELSFLKWGLAGCADRDWTSVLRQRAGRVGPRLVIAAYADAAQAAAPPVEDVVAFACTRPWPEPVLLIDTFDKARSPEGRARNLLHWLTPDTLTSIVGRCRQQGVRLALAGSLGLGEVAAVAELAPDWIAVRGAVCAGTDREQHLSAALLHDLVQRLTPQAPSRARPS